MNSFVQQHLGYFVETMKLRNQLLDTLTDADLQFTPGGTNPPLGEVCKEMGEVEHAYLNSIKTRKQDWSYRHPDAGIATSIDGLKTWYDALDTDLIATIQGLTDDDLNQMVDRGFQLPVAGQIHTYREALLIFYGRVSTYLKAMNKTISDQWRDWIA